MQKVSLEHIYAYVLPTMSSRQERSSQRCAFVPVKPSNSKAGQTKTIQKTN